MSTKSVAQLQQNQHREPTRIAVIRKERIDYCNWTLCGVWRHFDNTQDCHVPQLAP